MQGNGLDPLDGDGFGLGLQQQHGAMRSLQDQGGQQGQQRNAMLPSFNPALGGMGAQVTSGQHGNGTLNTAQQFEHLPYMNPGQLGATNSRPGNNMSIADEYDHAVKRQRLDDGNPANQLHQHQQDSRFALSSNPLQDPMRSGASAPDNSNMFVFNRPGAAGGATNMMGMRPNMGGMHPGAPQNQPVPNRMGAHMVPAQQNLAHQNTQMNVSQHNQALQSQAIQQALMALQGQQPAGMPQQGQQQGQQGGANMQQMIQQQLQQQQMKQQLAQMLQQTQQQQVMGQRLESLNPRMGMGGANPMGGFPQGNFNPGAGFGLRGGPMQQQHPSLSNPAMFQQLLMQRQQQQALQAQQAAMLQAPEPEEDKEEDILAKVGKISNKLRSMLGKSVTEKGFAGTDEQEAAAAMSTIVKRENLVEACGPIAGQLKSYQLVGINFLMMLHKSESVGGAILADEMGLGKTAQTISFLGVLRTLLNNRSPHLVVCPASLIQNWAREFKQWCPTLRVLMYHGKERDQAREALQRWRKKVRTAYKEGSITQLPPGMLLAEDEEAREEAREEAAQRMHQEDLEDPPDYGDGEDGGDDGMHLLGPDWDDSRPVGGLVLPGETSGEAAFDVMLTTYTLFEREGGYKADRAFLLKWKWGYMVADEAHALKNRSSIRTRKLRKVAASCESRILLTGTPLQNSLEELRALLEFLMPSLFMDPNNPGQDDTKDDELHMRKLDEEEQAARVERYKALLAPFILRRLKSEVATQLQSKKQVVQEVDMTPAQEKLYKAAVESMRREVAAASTIAAAKPRGRPRRNAVPAPGAAAAAGGSAAGTVEMLVARLGSQRVNNIFTHLRKVAQHPLLVRNVYNEQQIQAMAEIASTHSLFGGNCSYDRVFKELIGYSDHQLHTFASTYPSFLSEYMLDSSALMSSAKICILDDLMPKFFAGGSKVLLFSQWTMTLDLLQWYMQLKGFSYVRLDGSTQVEERLSLVDRFNDPDQGIFCFLLSTRAGGQGLNLTGADVVVLHDVDFNPQVDRQAEDRCHRLGQTKPVTVYRLVTKNTVDQNVLAIAERKLALDAAVLNDVTVTGNADAEEEGASAVPTGPKRGRPGLDSREVRHMGAILSALLSDE